MLRLAIVLGVVSALLLAGVFGWLIGSRPPVVVQQPATVRQAPSENLLYRDKRLVLYYLCVAEGRYVILDVGPQYLHAYQAGGCSPEAW